MTGYRIAVVPGDGVGPEISGASLKVLQAVQEMVGVEFSFTTAEMGDQCLRKYGRPLPNETVDVIRRSDACLKAPVGMTAAETIIKLRQMLDLYANLRPVKCYPGVDCVKQGINFVIVRENTECLYRGAEFEVDGVAVALRIITRRASERIAEQAFKLAEARGGKRSVMCVHKANVLKKTCGLFAEACRTVAARYRNITFSEMLVDAAAMNLIRKPEEFDVIVTTNMFGDILSDEAAQLVGGLGMAPSANIGDGYALFEPVHGSAPDIAGRGLVNPIAMILSAKMMLEWLAAKKNDSRCSEAATMIDEAVRRVLRKGVKTVDLGGENRTDEVASAVAREIMQRQA